MTTGIRVVSIEDRLAEMDAQIAAMTAPRCIHGNAAYGPCPDCAAARALRRGYDGPHDDCTLAMRHHHLPENRNATLPVMVDGKQRRPIGMRADVPDVDPAADGMGAVRWFEYREDAVAAGALMDGWRAWPQYVGRYDRWYVGLRRKSWPTGRNVLLGAAGDLRRIDHGAKGTVRA